MKKKNFAVYLQTLSFKEFNLITGVCELCGSIYNEMSTVNIIIDYFLPVSFVKQKIDQSGNKSLEVMKLINIVYFEALNGFLLTVSNH